MVYSISGFRDVSGKFVVMRAARKILQRPRRLGVGLCFEEADLRNDLAECAMRLFESIGYFGVFEIEFIVSGGRALLIDFNGRLYNQVAFDIARGVDLPAIAYAAAIGNQPEMARLVSTSATRIERGGLVFCDQLGLAITMITKRALGKLSFNETNHWRRWRETHSGQVVDAVNDSADPLPAFINAAQQFLKAVRHPRAFIWQAGLE
jgi:predicted ATP-grasp superfamily ATP-dependent carboligase